MKCRWSSCQNTELLYFVSLLSISSVSKSPSSSSFIIPRYSAIQSDRTHSWYGSLPLVDPPASSGVVTVVKQGLFFSKLSTSFFHLTPYSDYKESTSRRKGTFSFFLKGLCSYSFFWKFIEQIPFLLLSFARILFILGDFNYQAPF